MELRDYQIDTIELCKDIFANGVKKQNRMIVLPCGTGKTETFMRITNKRILVLQQNLSLVKQCEKRMQDFLGEVICVGNGIHLTQDMLDKSENKIVVATVQTLIKDIDNINKDSFDLIVIDECHHTMSSDRYLQIISKLDYILCLGMTATPPITSTIFDSSEILYEMPIFEAWKKGILMKPKNYSVNLEWKIEKNVKKYCNSFISDEEYTDKDIEEAIALDLISNFKTILNTCKSISNCEKTIIYFPTIKLCEDFSKFATEQGIECYSITSKTKIEDRNFIIERFRKSRNVMIANVDVMSEGIDIPDIETIFMARPLKNRNKAIQIYGRAFRKFPSKTKCNIIDLVVQSGDFIYSQNFATCFFPIVIEDLVKIPAEMIHQIEKKIREENDFNKLEKKIKDIKNIYWMFSEEKYVDFNTYGWTDYWLKKDDTILEGRATIKYKKNNSLLFSYKPEYLKHTTQISYRINLVSHEVFLYINSKEKTKIICSDNEMCFKQIEDLCQQFILQKAKSMKDITPILFKSRYTEGTRSRITEPQLQKIQKIKFSNLPLSFLKTLSKNQASKIISRCKTEACLEKYFSLFN